MEIQKSNIDFRYDFNGIEGIENDIFPPNFCGCIIGKPGSGKTTLLRYLLLDPNLLYKKYDYVYIMSPSIEEYPFVMNKQSITNKFDLGWIYSNLKAIPPSEKHLDLLIIIDDFISYLKDNATNPELISLFFNRRHIVNNATISILLTSQRYMTIPATIRSVLNIIILFQLSFRDLFKIWEEHISIPRKAFFSLVSSLSYRDFLVCNIQEKKFFVRFDQVIFSQ
jgi:Cdc6-like AAA superfamily ATPase